MFDERSPPEILRCYWAGANGHLVVRRISFGLGGTQIPEVQAANSSKRKDVVFFGLVLNILGHGDKPLHVEF